MNKTFKYAISVVLGAAIAVPAFAQRDNFPDVADTHWASDAVARLKKEGILTGYPDGTFKGNRMITRYELATVIYAIYMNLKNVTDGLDSQIKALEEKVNGMEGKMGGSNDGNMKATLEALRSDVNAMKAWGDDINSLKKVSASYQKELTSLGVDVEKMKKDIADMKAKMMSGTSNAMASGVSISGDVNFWVAANSKGSSGASSINQDGRYTQGNATGAGLDTLTVLHELALKLSADKVKGTIVVGNMVGAGNGFGDQASIQSRFDSTYKTGNTSIYLHDLYTTLSDSMAGMGFDAKVGRQGLKISPYVMQRIDNTSFFENERYDNGEYAIDGVSFSTGFGGNAKLRGFLGTTSSQNTTNGGVVQTVRIGAENFIPGADVLQVARTMGAVLDFGLGENGGVSLSFVDFDGNALAAGRNRQEVIGADLNYKLGGNLHLMAGAGKSTGKLGNTNISNTANNRVNAGVKYDSGSLSLMGNYRRIEANYFAPGDWGRTGIYRNLNNVMAVDATANFKLNDTVSLNGSFSKGEEITGTGEFDSTRVGVDYKLNGNWTLMGSYEDTKFKSGWSAIGNPNFKFTTLGFGYDMGANTLFKLWYQYSETANFTFPGAGVNPNGGFIAAQLSVKF